MEMHDIRLAHLLPGRVRLRAPRIKGDHQLAREIEDYLLRAPNVRHVEMNRITGSVLIRLDPPDEQSLSALETLFPGSIFSEVENRGPACSPSEQEGMRFSNQVISERVSEMLDEVNARVSDATGGVDLKIIVPGVLLLLGMYHTLMSKDELVSPKWYEFFWFCYNTYGSLASAQQGEGE